MAWWLPGQRLCGRSAGGLSIVRRAANNILERRKARSNFAGTNPGNELITAKMETMPAPWVPSIACRPIAFAQVREDAALDRWVVEQLDGEAEVLMIASGGCTAAALAAAAQISRLHLVDLNAAQLALSRLKLRLLATATPDERAAVLGHTSMPMAARRQRLIAELRKLNLPL